MFNTFYEYISCAASFLLLVILIGIALYFLLIDCVVLSFAWFVGLCVCVFLPFFNYLLHACPHYDNCFFSNITSTIIIPHFWSCRLQCSVFSVRHTINHDITRHFYSHWTLILPDFDTIDIIWRCHSQVANILCLSTIEVRIIALWVNIILQ